MNKNNILDDIKTIFDKIVYVVEFLVSLLLAIEILEIVTIIACLKYIPYITIVIATVLLIVFVSIIYYLIKTRKDKIEKMFLTFAIPLSIAFAIFILPLHVPDEASHILRAYDISLGNIFTKFDEQGNSTCTVIKEFENITIKKVGTYSNLSKLIQKETNYEDTIQDVSSAQSYSPLLYIGPSFGFLISRTTGLNIFYGIYLGRLFNVLIFLTLGYFSIKKIPFGKLLLVVCLCMPMMLQQVASCSADSILNTVLIYFISHILYMIFKEEKITLKDRIVLYILTALIATFKCVYLLVAGIFFIGIFKKKEERKQFIKTSIIMVIIGAIFAFSWLLIDSKYTSTSLNIKLYIENENINPERQIDYIKNNPLDFIKLLTEKYVNNTKAVSDEAIGSVLDLYYIKINPLIILAFSGILILSAISEKSKFELSKKSKIWILSIIFAITLLVYIVMYINYTPVGSNDIIGVQGRYYSPLVVLVLMCLIRKDKNFEVKNVNKRILVSAFVLNILTIMQVANTYIL